MASAASGRTIINPELLRREAELALTRQPGWLAFGLSVPLAVALYTLLRPWQAERAARDLMQAALFLSAWNIVYALVYICIHWLHKQHDTVELEQRHLPLAPTHFALRRVMLMTLVPLTASALALLVWGVLLLFYQRPYLTDAGTYYDTWIYPQWLGMDLKDPWSSYMWWVTSCIVSGTWLVISLAIALDLLVRKNYLRSLLLLLLPTALYFAIKVVIGGEGSYGGEWLFMNYRETRGVSPWPYLILLVIVVIAPLIFGLCSAKARCWMVATPLLLCALYTARPALPVELRRPLQPLANKLVWLDTRYALALYLGHLSPPQNIRWLDYGYPNNVLFQGKMPIPDPGPEPESTALPGEPPSPANNAPEKAWNQWWTDDAKWRTEHPIEVKAAEAKQEAWYAALSKYEAQRDHWPRLYMWVTAGLYPLLLPLWCIFALLLGVHLRGDRVRA